jgi:thioredoxin-like negative regulator of GroEL
MTLLAEQAVACHKAGHLEEAGNLYLRLLELDPNNAGALHMLGAVLFASGQVERALHFMRRAQQRLPDSAQLQTNLGNLLQEMGRLDEALACFDQAARLDPHFAALWSNRGLLMLQLRRFDEALENFDLALGLDPDLVDVRWHAALARLQRGDYARGWAEYEWRWHKALRPATGTEGPRWTGAEDLAGRTVLLHAEQGFGDTLQFCRYAPLVAARGARVVMAVQAPLVRLLQSLPGVAKVVDIAGKLPPFDLQCPMMSLPWACGTSLDTIPAAIPYLAADPARSAAWRARLAALPGRKIGLVWAGAPRPHDVQSNRIDRRRSMKLAQLGALAGCTGIDWISLQKGPPARQAERPPCGMVLHDWTEELHDFADTAALVAGLDLLISVDTAMTHLGGALGIPVWVLNRHDTCWRWLHDRDDTPWYPSMRLFTQTAPGDWAQVVARVKEAL